MPREKRKKAALPRLKMLLLFAAVLLASCDGTVYHRFEQVESAGWSGCDTLSFLYEGNGVLADDAGVALAVQVRYAAAYKYRNLCMRVESCRACGEQLSVDTLCCAVYDEEGRRLGSTAGAMYQNGSEQVVIPAALCADTLIFKVSHMMDEDILCGVYDVGLKLSAVKM